MGDMCELPVVPNLQQRVHGVAFAFRFRSCHRDAAVLGWRCHWGYEDHSLRHAARLVRQYWLDCSPRFVSDFV